MNDYKIWAIIGICFLLCSCKSIEPASSGEAHLSNLNADENSAIYATYAAAIDRSEFIVDEGYQFMFYEDDRPISFFTDAGPEISFVFKKGEQVVQTLGQMHQAPEIKASYPDLVVYKYKPFEGIEAEVRMVVHSSRGSFWDIAITNNTSSKEHVSVIPYINNTDQAFGQPQKLPDDNAFFFTHSQYPDSWTRRMDLPHVTKRWNIFHLSGEMDKMGVFNSFDSQNFIPPSEVITDKEPKFQISGRAYTKNEKARIIQKAPHSRIQVFFNDNKNKLITQNSPVWGGRQSIIDSQGYFRLELGVLGEITEGRQYTFTYYDERSGDVGRYTKPIKKEGESTSIRNDVTLGDYSLPPVPLNVDLSRNVDGPTIDWKGDSPSTTYRIYRRTYQEPFYTLIKSDINRTEYTDRSAETNKTYGYVVVAEDETGQLGMHSREVTTIPVNSFSSFLNNDESKSYDLDQAKVLAFKKKISLNPGDSHTMRLSRYVTDRDDYPTTLTKAKGLNQQKVDFYIRENESLFDEVPTPDFNDGDKEMLYWSSFNMMRQVFYPPEGKSSYNYYVFSREPVWGWGHGGQVFHESITMMAYALLDPESAMNSQRVYKERQYENGYINYRTGSYLDEIIEYNDQLTSSAPWYSWINYEVYKMTGDKKFLKEMYESSKAFYEFYVSNRDSDNDGLAEWGGHAVLESVRDAAVAVWDEVDWPSNFEGVDVNAMLVKEAKSLEKMALELGLKEEAQKWRQDHQKRAKLINETFWDEENGFYYNVDKETHTFSHESKNDLKRDEIIGFLPLWAGIATEEQAEKLVEKLTDPDHFWRKYGVPSLSASDPYYNDKGYWNGPVWVEWNYLVMQGLLKYGYEKEAKELVDRVAESMIIQLKKNHTLWEFYSPDEKWGGYHQTYIWAGIINRMLMDVHHLPNK